MSWFNTLPGCTTCGYDFKREPGYFLTAAWFLNWQVIMVFGIFSFFILDDLFQLNILQLFCFNTVFTVAIVLLTVRHTKAIFMAFDHLVDPLEPYVPTDKLTKDSK